VQDQTGLSGRQRALIIAVAIVVLVGGYLLIRGGGDDNGGGGVTTVRVVNAKPEGGIKKLAFKKGDQVSFKVVSDTADEIHVHGYDLMKDVEKGGSVSFSFKGSIDGRFVVELEDHKQQIAELDVTP
jgi:predicted ATP-grasp superfamily ATP-dependent carboligase